MPLSQTDIANQALVRIGERVIMDINDSTAVTARKCKVVFEQSVREIGASHAWNGLKDRATLALLATAPAFGWDCQYQLPTNYLRLVKLNGVDVNNDEPGDFCEIEGTKLLTDETTAQIQYVKYSADTALYAPLFIKALVTLLASKLALTIRQDEAMASNLLGTYEQVDLPKARMKDSSEGKRRRYNPASESRFVAARRFSTNG